MNLKLKVRKVGNSVGVILPKAVLEHLRVAEGDPVYATEAPDGSLRLSATSGEFERQMEAAQSVMRRYRNTLRELAK
jgi:putative addiction module antidote